jgi:hypothetical protein
MAIIIKRCCKKCGKEIPGREEIVHTCTAGIVTVKEELCPECRGPADS